MSRTARRIAVGLLAAGVTAGAVAWATRPTPTPPPDWADAYDVDARPPDAVPPGTVIDAGPPAGWSHLVAKGKPRVRPTERDKVNAVTARMAAWMFTAFLADVRPETDGGPPRLRAVALGLGCEVNGHDTVVTPETGDRLGADLGWIGRTVLTKGYERQRQSRIVTRSPTFAVVDTPLWVRLAGKNRLARFRHALAVGPGGSLDVVVWMVGPDGLFDPPAVVRLAPNTIDEAELVIDTDEFTLGVPSEAAFAVDRLPPGRSLGEWPADLRPLAARDRFTPADAHALEDGVRQLLAADLPR